MLPSLLTIVFDSLLIGSGAVVIFWMANEYRQGRAERGQAAIGEPLAAIAQRSEPLAHRHTEGLTYRALATRGRRYPRRATGRSARAASGRAFALRS